MATYSKYTGLPYEALSTGLILSSSSPYGFTNDYVLEDVYDNETKSVIPKNIRDMLLSSWDSTAFKQTFGGSPSVYYIGIDTGNTQSYLDIKGSKVYLGKRSYLATDVMNTALLSGQADVYLHNTKKDTVSQGTTRVAFLSGKNNALHTSAPYVEAQVVKTGTSTYSISMNIINPSNLGDIHFLSRGRDVFGQDTDTGGTVSVNGVVFPTYDGSDPQFGGSASDGRILAYDNGGMVWKDLNIANSGFIGVTGSEMNIYASVVNINGYPLEFTETMHVPREFGDVRLGATFSGESLTKLLQKMVYSYLPPLCTLSLANSTGYVEVGTYPQIRLNYSITKRSKGTLPTLLVNMIPSSYPAISTYEHRTVEGTADGVIISPVSATSSVFTVKVNDGDQTNTASVSVTGVYPYFYGFTSSSTIKTYSLNSLDKLVEPKGDKTLGISGTGNFYFLYDAAYGALSEIRDSYNNNIIASFSSSNAILSSPTGLWTARQFIIYKWADAGPIGPPSENFQFKH